MLYKMLDDMAWEVATYRHLSDTEIGQKPASRLVLEYERVCRRQWDDMARQVTATEQGVLRALAAAFGGQKPPDFPTWDEVRRKQSGGSTELSAFVKKFMEANAKPHPPE